ncbi:MAG: GTPase HflX [Firmicutes bacterium]|nr:GTPase HflX [Bacillota bacterium]
MERTPTPTGPEGPQRALLVGLERSGGPTGGWTAEESLAELALLAETAGAEVVGTVIQRRPRPDPATFIGEGKAREIEARRQVEGFDLVIFDDELTPTQQRNLESIIGCAIIDRPTLILDIFATRARTREAQLQVELAQLQYRLPRLAGQGVDLSRLGGGIGTRGPGETKLEVDRRRIRERIAKLQEELEAIREHRQRLRRERERTLTPVVALTGYTNAGKSTLHRVLAGSDVLAEDKLFATLDATARRVEPPAGGTPYLLVDTVGFIHKLPHQLVAAFRSTLEEVVAADLILHVVDLSHRKWPEQMATVTRVLRELGAQDHPQIVVFNKIDRPEVSPAEVARVLRQYPGSVAISARTGAGLEDLAAAIQERLASRYRVVEVVVPYDRSQWVAYIHHHGRVLAEEHRPEGTFLRAELPGDHAGRVLAALGGPAAESRTR